MKKLLAILLALTMVFAVAAVSASAEMTEWPTKEISFIIPYSAGGGTDAIGRAYAEALAKELGVDVVCQNMVGGSGMVAAAYVTGCPNDGSTILFGTVELVALPATGQTDDTVTAKTLTPICLVNMEPNTIVVRTGSKYESVAQMIEALQADPECITLGGYNGGFNCGDIHVKYLESEYGVKFVPVPFNNGASEGIAAAVGGHVDAVNFTLAECDAQIQAGALTPLAVAADERLTYWPEVPTLKELGYDVSTGTWRGVFLPGDASEDLVALLEAASAKVVESESFKEYMTNAKSTIAYKGTADFNEFIDAQWTSYENAAK